MIRLYRLFLVAYPARVRESLGRDMQELFADLCREERRRRGWTATASVIVRTFAELPFSAIAARRSNAGAHSHQPTAGHERSSSKSSPFRRRAPLDPRNGGKAGLLDAAIHNLRYATRNLRRSPGFATVVILTLALGIGAITVVFTVVNGVLLSPLPYESPERLVRLYTARPENLEQRQFVPGSGFLAFREQTDLFEGLGTLYTYRETSVDLIRDDNSQRIVMMPISSRLLEILGVEPLLGREFLPEEETGASTVAMISYGLWQSAFAGDPDILGRNIDLQGFPHTVVGVLPPGFRNPIGGSVDLYRPDNMQPGGRNSWGNFYLSVIGRLRPGVTIEQAHDQLDALVAGIAVDEPRATNVRARLVPLLEDTVGHTSTMLWVLMAAVGMVLMIACVNVANLFLARSADRWKELAIRAALGAGRRRLVAQMLTESLLLGAAGGVAGLLLSFAGLRAVIAFSPDNLPRLSELGIDFQIFAFAAAVSLLTGLVFGIAPALHFSRPQLERTLRNDSRGNTRGNTGRLRDGLVIAEVAISLVLLLGAGLLTKSFMRVLDVDLGIGTESVLTYEVHLPQSRYAEPQQRIAFYDRFFARARSIADVQGIGAVSYLPTEGRYHIWGLGRADLDLEDDDAWTAADVRIVDGDYLELMGIQLLRGRSFEPSDTLESQKVILINEALAAAHFTDRDPLGTPVGFSDAPFEVVGIVSDTAFDPLGATSPKVYVSHAQYADDRNWAMIQTVRTSGDPLAIVGQLRAELGEIDSQLVLYRIRTMQDVVDRGISPQRFSMLLMITFAAAAVALAAIGIYGVLSYTVSQRTREIGIRMALGADVRKLRGMVMRQCLALTTTGLLLGVILSMGLTSWLASMLFEVEPGDPFVLAVVAAGLVTIATLAGYLPARRATAVDPMTALRRE